MEIFKEALIDTGSLVPLLILIYFLVGFMEYRFGSRIRGFIIRFSRLGPVLGALFGCVPQCGFSVMASALYVKRLISVGTLLSVFISTSDEAVPVLLAMPQKANMVGMLIITKVIVAIIAGMGIDFFICYKKVDLGVLYEEHFGCCLHELSGKHSNIKALVIHPLLHMIKIFLFLFILTLILNFFIWKFDDEKIRAVLLSGTVFQPVLTSLIGFIPNCFSSVLLAGLYAKGSISFGAMFSGLCAGTGLGALVLIKENKRLKDTLFVIGLLLIVSIISGSIIHSMGFQ